MKKYITLNALILFALYRLSFSVFAAEPAVPQVLRVSPAILPISLTPGKILNLILTVENLTADPIPVKAEIESFESADEEGGYTFTASQSPLVSWITVDRPDMILNPGIKREIAVTVKVPSQVAVGGYYAVIFLTPYGPVQQDVPRIVPRIGVPIFASLGIDENMKTGSIETFTLNPTLSRTGAFSYTLRVKDSGLSHFTAKPVIRAKSVFGRELTTDLSEKVILPGKIRR